MSPRPSWPLAALLLVVALVAVAPGVARAQPAFDYLFWQPDLAGVGNDLTRVRSELDRAAAAGVRGIVVQYIAHGDQSLLDATLPDGRDPLRVLMDEAWARGLEVWLGTWENPAIWRTRAATLASWRSAMVRGTELAAVAADRYGDHPALAGWYYTPEAVWWAPPSGHRLERLTALTAEAVARLKALTGHPVAIVLGPSGRGEANLLPISWCRYVQGAAPDVVVVMDGVGSAHIDVMLAPALYQVMHRCAERAGATLWADVELFGPEWSTPSIERMEAQYAAARSHAPVVVGFDLTHHLAEGTAGARFWGGERAPTGRLPTSEPVAEPAGLWSVARPRVRRGTVELRLEGPARRLPRVEVVVRGEASAVTIEGLRVGGGLVEGGAASPEHGPGRDEWTWVWEPADAPRLAGVRVTVTAGRRAPDVLEVRLIPLPGG